MLGLRRVLRSGALRQLSSLSGKPQGDVLPRSCEVLIIGGGGMGASSALWLKSRALQLGRKLNVLVVERDAGVWGSKVAPTMVDPLVSNG
ncbi:GD15335 [Drosophila simulans]|uniref:GD15335 n=1 Tax=Drosophila simulans TaxID=7240 RepID=B4NS32_DROSI|nr:GD15335 [Drosophila simulans]